jgi:hypothetical protein
MGTSVNFQRTLAGLRDDQVIIPVIRAALNDPDFAPFDVRVRGWEEGRREFDGWFHPSTHASWTARQLALYLRHGAEMKPQPPGLSFVASVTQGLFWHRFAQQLLLDKGILRRNPGTTEADDIEDQCEVTLVDSLHNRRGHADGRMAMADDELFEMKTMTPRKVDQFTEKILRDKNPYGYYSQTQDYLDIAGFPKMRYFVLGMASPYAMQEFVVHADPVFQSTQRKKYRQAVEAVQDGRLPQPCCGVGSTIAKNCVVGEFCEIGRMSHGSR